MLSTVGEEKVIWKYRQDLWVERSTASQGLPCARAVDEIPESYTYQN